MHSGKNDDPHNLQRFLDAQEATFDQAKAELGRGKKQSHWMWFIFPQLRGLGQSAMARRFGISNIREAEAYLEHSILGSRLRECTALVNAAHGTVTSIFGYPDDLKFHSSMTLFAIAAKPFGPENGGFAQALADRFSGKKDANTLRLLGNKGNS